MSTLVEMIEALQAKWRELAEFYNFDEEVECKEDEICNRTRKAHVSVWKKNADQLAPILAAARKQGSALCRQAADITNLRMELAAMKEQHSADLREVAEMAIGACDYTAKVVKPWPTAASIVREFREKKAKVRK